MAFNKKQTNETNTKTWTSLVETRFQLIFGDALKVGHVLLSIFFYIGLKANCAWHRTKTNKCQDIFPLFSRS